jgi:hypothetical protein
MRGGGLLIGALLVLVIIYNGPALAKQFSASAQQIIDELQPIVATVLIVVLVVLVIKYYWQRYR